MNTPITLDTNKRNALYNALKKTLSTQAPDFSVTQFLDGVVHVKASKPKANEPNPEADNIIDYFGFKLPEENTPIQEGEKNHTPMMVKTYDGAIYLVDAKLNLIMNHNKANPNAPQTKWRLKPESVAKRSIPCDRNFETWYEWNCAFFELASESGDLDPKHYLYPLYKDSFVNPPKMWKFKDEPKPVKPKADKADKGPKKPSRFGVVKRWITHYYDGVTKDELENVKTKLKGVTDTDKIFEILTECEYEPDEELSKAIDNLDAKAAKPKEDKPKTKKPKTPEPEPEEDNSEEDNSEEEEKEEEEEDEEDEPESPKPAPKPTQPTFDPDASEDEDESEDASEPEPPKTKARKLPWKK